jgi:hypothetical protein
MPEIAGSIPAVRTNTSCSSRGKEPGFSLRETRVRLPYTTPGRLRLLMDSGSESTKLRMVVRVHPESRYATLGNSRPRSGIRWVSKTRQRGSIPRRPASTASSSPGGGIGLIRRTCRVRFPGLLPDDDMASRSPGGDGSSTHCRRRVRFPGSLPRVLLAQRQVQSPDKRPTKVRLLHGTRS